MKGMIQKMSNVVKISKLKKKAKSHVGFLSFLLVIAIVCFFLLSPIFSIESITVSGNVKVSSEEIVSASGIVYAQNILRIDKFSAINKVMNIPYIKNVDIKRNWPNEICVNVEENVPVASVTFYGSKILLDENGYILEVITDDLDSGLAKLNGISAKSITTGKKLECSEKEILESYLEILKIFNNNDMLNEVSKIFVEDGEYLIELKSGHVTNLGKIDNLQYKVLLLNEIISRETNPVYVNLSDLNMIVTKPVWGMFSETKNNEKN